MTREKKLSVFFCGAIVAIMVFYHIATALVVSDTFNVPVSSVLFHGSGLYGTIGMSGIVAIFIGAIVFILTIGNEK